MNISEDSSSVDQGGGGYLIIGNNFNFSMLEHSDTRIGGAEVDSDDSSERFVLGSHQGGGQEERGREYGLHAVDGGCNHEACCPLTSCGTLRRRRTAKLRYERVAGHHTTATALLLLRYFYSVMQSSE